MVLQLRPKGDPTAPAYSPHRDLAYIGPHILRQAALMLDSDNYTADLAADLQAAGVTEEDFGRVGATVGKTLKMFMMTPVIKNPEEALELCGFSGVKGLANRIYFAAFGELLFSAMLRGIRETGRYNEDAPQQRGICETIAFVTDYLQHRGYEVPVELDTSAADVLSLQMTNEHQAAMIRSLQDKLEAVLTKSPEV